MRRIFTVLLVMALAMAAYAPGASASEDVCNYGRMASNAAGAPGSMQHFTGSSGPLTINSNQTNLPPGQEDKNLLGCTLE